MKKETIMEENISDDCLLRVPRIVKCLSISRSHWWAGVKVGKYPPGFKLSERIRVWRGKEIKALINGGIK